MLLIFFLHCKHMQSSREEQSLSENISVKNKGSLHFSLIPWWNFRSCSFVFYVFLFFFFGEVETVKAPDVVMFWCCHPTTEPLASVPCEARTQSVTQHSTLMQPHSSTCWVEAKTEAIKQSVGTQTYSLSSFLLLLILSSEEDERRSPRGVRPLLRRAAFLKLM